MFFITFPPKLRWVCTLAFLQRFSAAIAPEVGVRSGWIGVVSSISRHLSHISMASGHGSWEHGQDTGLPGSWAEVERQNCVEVSPADLQICYTPSLCVRRIPFDVPSQFNERKTGVGLLRLVQLSEQVLYTGSVFPLGKGCISEQTFSHPCQDICAIGNGSLSESKAHLQDLIICLN